MHWLPLVAMVIASALPFPHNPDSTIATVSESDSSSSSRSSSSLSDPPADHDNLRGNVSRVEPSRRLHGGGGVESARTRAVELRDSRPGAEIPDVFPLVMTERDSGSDFEDFSKHTVSTVAPLEVSTVTNPDPVSPATILKGQRGPEATASSGHLRPGTGSSWRLKSRTAPAERSVELLEGDEMLLYAHPRVLFSPSPLPPEDPPLLLMLEDELMEGDGEEQEDVDRHFEGHGDRAIERSGGGSNKRRKRSQDIKQQTLETSVCQSQSMWVTDKRTAIDWKGENVTILQEVQTQAGPIKQYFYETRCMEAEQRGRAAAARAGQGVDSSAGGSRGCLGVDKKHWHSECKSKQTYVRALTRDARNRTGWRWIRIDSSCVCVLVSRTNLSRHAWAKGGRG